MRGMGMRMGTDRTTTLHSTLLDSTQLDIQRHTLRLGQARLDSNTDAQGDTQIMAMAMATTGQSGGNIVATVIQCAICG